VPAAAVDVGFHALVVAAPCEILEGRDWRNLNVVLLAGLLLAGNAAFHLDGHLSGTADYSSRVVVVVASPNLRRDRSRRGLITIFSA
jgi:uncharacterized protein involved in response to NO